MGVSGMLYFATETRREVFGILLSREPLGRTFDSSIIFPTQLWRSGFGGYVHFRMSYDFL